MECPSCQNRWIKVVETNTRERDYIARKRQCAVCDHAWFTVEQIVSPDSITWRRAGGTGGRPVLRKTTAPPDVPEIPGTIEHS